MGVRKRGKGMGKDKGIVGTIKSLFDSNEKTVWKSAAKGPSQVCREVVKTLCESLEEDGKDVAKFRRIVDAAKESIREYLTGWREQHAVITEESYVALEKAIKVIGWILFEGRPVCITTRGHKTSILDDFENCTGFSVEKSWS